MIHEFVKALKHVVAKEVEAIMLAMTSEQCSDWADYKARCRHIKGMNKAVEMAAELAKTFDPGEDEGGDGA